MQRVGDGNTDAAFTQAVVDITVISLSSLRYLRIEHIHFISTVQHEYSNKIQSHKKGATIRQLINRTKLEAHLKAPRKSHNRSPRRSICLLRALKNCRRAHLPHHIILFRIFRILNLFTFEAKVLRVHSFRGGINKAARSAKIGGLL